MLTAADFENQNVSVHHKLVDVKPRNFANPGICSS